MEETRRSITILRGNDFNVIWGFSDAQGNPINLEGVDYKLSIRSSKNGPFSLVADSIENGVVKATVHGENIPTGKYYFDFSWKETKNGVTTSYRSKTDEIVYITENISEVSDYSTVNVDSIIIYSGSSQALKDVYVITTNDETEPSDFNVFSAKRSQKEFISKTSEDSTPFLLKLLAGAVFGDNKGEITKDGIARIFSVFFENGLYSKDFSSGYLGKGVCVKVDENGDSYIEADKLFIRKFAEFVELLIQEIKHVGGQIILTPASMKCTGVEETDTYYRCYFKSTDGDKTIQNQFVVGDQARSQTFNIKEGTTQHAINTYYWRLVTGVGEDYIDLSRSDCDNSSTIPKSGDDIIQLGNRNDPTRQTAIILSAFGDDAPSIKMYRGIKSFNLDDAEKIFNISSKEVYIRADVLKLTTGENITESIKDVTESVGQLVTDMTLANEAINSLQKQVDGVVEIWFYDDAPSLENEPAVNWITDEEKDRHLGDIYYDSDGNGYRFEKRDGQYVWGIISDTVILKALETAKKAQDTADGKKRVFVEQPKDSDAYDIGDLWVNATYEQRGYKNDLLRCSVTKTANSPFSIDHWELASKYTDDTKANQAIEDAANAQTAANEAQQKADEAQNRLDLWASDGVISPTEKQGIKDEIVRINSDKQQIENGYNKYGLGSPTSYINAYNFYYSDLVSLSQDTPENINIPSTFAGIQRTYYDERTKSLTAISDAAKDAVDSMENSTNEKIDEVNATITQTKNEITLEVNSVRSDLSTFKEETNTKFSVQDGKITSAVTESKEYADSAVDSIQVGGRNLLRNSTFLYDLNYWYKYDYEGSYSISKLGNYQTLLISRSGYTGNTITGIKQELNLDKGTYTLSLKYRTDQLDDTRNQAFVRVYSSESSFVDKGIITIQNTKGVDSNGEITFTVDTTPTKAELYIVLSKNGKLRVWEIKLEQGNKATAWSPAPEDSIDQMLQGSVGNYILNSAFDNGTSNWVAQGSLVISVDTETHHQVGVNTLKVVQSAAANTALTGARVYQEATKLNPASLSFWVKASKTTQFKVRLGGDESYTKTISIGTEWQRVKIEDATPSTNAVVFGALSACTWWLSESILTNTTTAYNWQPSNKDVVKRIEVNSSKIEQLPDQITLTVEQKIGEIQVGGRNLFLNTKNGGDWYANNWSSGKYVVKKVASEEIVGGIALTEITRFYRSENTGGGDVKYQPASSAHNKKEELKEKYVTISFFIRASEDSTVELWTCTLSNTAVSDKSPTNFNVTTSWEKKEITVKTKSELQGDGFQCYFRTNDIGANIDLALFKVEIGNKATDWSPAPEDIDDSLTTLSSEIKQTADSITSTVKKEISGITIGGDNCLTNSDFSDGTSGWSYSSVTISADNSNTHVSGISVLRVVQASASDSNLDSIRIFQYAGISVGDTVSFSCWVRASVATKIKIRLCGGSENMKEFSVGTKWTYITFENVTASSTAVILGATSACTWYLSEPMLVKANKATSWAKKLSEQVSEISTIKQTANSISLKVDDINDGLSATGIDITNKRIDITADKLRIKNNSGTPIAVFDGSGSTPKLKAENIDVDNLKVKYLQGATGTFKGVLEAASGSFNGELVVSLLRTRLYTIPGGSSSFEVRPDVDNCCNYYFGENHVSSGNKYPSKINVLLPQADFYEGMEISFFRMVTNNTSPYQAIISTIGKIYFLNPYDSDPNFNYITTADQALISANKRVVFKSMDGKWFNIEGNCYPIQ